MGGGDFGGKFGWILQGELGDVRGELWHASKSLKADFNGGKMTHFKVGIQMNDMVKHEIHWH